MESVLSKKMNGNKVGRSPISDTERLGDQFIRALERHLFPILGTSTSGMILDVETTRMSSVTEGIPVPALLGLLEFPGAKTNALINISADLVYHMLDLCMGGDPEVCPTPTTRSFTEIDYALCEEILEATADAFLEAISGELGGALSYKFKLLDIQQNITAITVAPDTAGVLAFEGALDIGDAARGGDINFVIPLSVLDVIRSSLEKTDQTTGVTRNDIWRERMRQAAGEATIPLRAVLHRTSYKTSFLDNLEVGQVLEISGKAPENVSLTMRSNDGNEVDVAVARLGGYEGKKVLKLTSQLNPTMVQHLKNLIQN